MLLDPAAGATDVPVNLAAVMVRFAAPVVWGPQGLRDLRRGVPAPPQPIACDGGVCYRARPGGRACGRCELPGGDRRRSRPRPAGPISGAARWAASTSPPGGTTCRRCWRTATVDAAGPCAAVRFATDEPATATVVIVAAGGEVSRTLGWGQTTFDAAMALVSLPPSIAATATITATDRAGNVAVAPVLEFQTPPALPAVAITEVLANAAGPEPGQEYVELHNLGAEPVALAGLRVEDSKGGDDLPDETLPRRRLRADRSVDLRPGAGGRPGAARRHAA